MMKKWFPLTFARNAKPFINVTFRASFFHQNRKTRIFHFWKQKSEKMHFLASGALFAPKTLQKRKNSPKAKKAVLGVLGSKNVPRTLRLSLFCARSENGDFSSFAQFYIFPLFGRKSCFGRPEVVKTAQNAKKQPFCAFLRKRPPKHLKEHWLEQHFWPLPVFSVLERKGRKSAFWGAKVRKTALFALFGSKSQKKHFWRIMEIWMQQ